MKRNNKNFGTDEVFQLVIEYLEGNIDKESFDKILEFLIKNQKVETSSYVYNTCLSIPREDQINNIRTTDKDLNENFNNFKNLILWVNEIFFFKKENFFKKLFLETSEIYPTQIQSQTDNINISGILERLIRQLQNQVSSLKNQFGRKDKVIKTLLENLWRITKHHEEISPF